MLPWFSSIFGVVPFAACLASTPGKGTRQDQVAAIILVAEDGAIVLEGAGCRRLVHELELEADALAFRFRLGEIGHRCCPYTAQVPQIGLFK
jgi:hypothetical protein